MYMPSVFKTLMAFLLKGGGVGGLIREEGLIKNFNLQTGAY